MAELLIRATSVSHEDPVEDQSGCWKAGMVVAVYEDGTVVEPISTRTPFVLIRIPTVSPERLEKYLQPDYDATDLLVLGEAARPNRRRRWRMRLEDLPVAARNRLRNDRELTIAVPGYNGSHDYTWAQVREYFRDQRTGNDEAGDP